MQVDIRHSPSYAVARCKIAPGEIINVESGAMYAQSQGIEITSKMQGGLFGALKRSLLSGDSFFVSEFSAKNGGWVDVAPNSPGDVFEMDITPGEDLILTRGAWLASDQRITLDTQFAGAKIFIGGEGLFTVRCSGQGKLIGSAYGALDVHELGEGDVVTVDTGHVVAYAATVRTNIRKAGKGILSSLKSGEGLVMDFYGPGILVTQSRNPAGFASFVIPLLPSSGNR